MSPSARVTCPTSFFLVRKRRTIKIPGGSILPPRKSRPYTTSTASAVEDRFRGGDPDGKPGGKIGETRQGIYVIYISDSLSAFINID